MKNHFPTFHIFTFLAVLAIGYQAQALVPDVPRDDLDADQKAISTYLNENLRSFVKMQPVSHDASNDVAVYLVELKDNATAEMSCQNFTFKNMGSGSTTQAVLQGKPSAADCNGLQAQRSTSNSTN